MIGISDLENERLNYQPKTPTQFEFFTHLIPEAMKELPVDPEISPFFNYLKTHSLLTFSKKEEGYSTALNVGIVFSGGPAAGGHNVAAGIFDALQKFNSASRLIGFIGGPAGIVANNWCILDEKKIATVRNQGGFDLLGSGRTKIETEEQLVKCKEACELNSLDGLLVVGGDDSNTNAAILADYFLSTGCKTVVVGVPKTIDGDLKNEWIETSFGFDSASKTYSEIIGNVMTDAESQNKYYFFVKVMGRSASHLILECALQTSPNLTLIGEEVKEKGSSLNHIIQSIADLIRERAAIGKYSGVILLPEGLIEFIPEFKKMIEELNGKPDALSLSQESMTFFQSLPKDIQKQLFLNPDPHGNIQVSKIETERLVIDLVEKELASRPDFTAKFNAQPLFVGYEGRSCLPSNFDSDYCYTLGMAAALLIAHKQTGVMAVVRNLNEPAFNWTCQGVPLICMIHMALRGGKQKPVIHQNLVDTDSPLFQLFESKRDANRLVDNYRNPGPIQFFGPPSISDRVTETLKQSVLKDKI